MKTWLAAGALGLVAVPLWWLLSARFFEGHARSLLWVHALVLALVLGGLWLLLRPPTRSTWPRYAQHFGVAVVVFLAAAGGYWAILISQEDHCGPQTSLFARWDEPGVANATLDGIPGATEVEHPDWARQWLIDGTDITITIRPSDDVAVRSHLDVGWASVSGHVNRTLGQTMALTYQNLDVPAATSVC